MNPFILVLALMMPSGHVQPHLTISEPVSQAQCETLRDHAAVRESYLSPDFWNGAQPAGQPMLVCREYGSEENKVYEMRVTGYYARPGAKGALAQPIRPGGTAAVSPGCIGLLGETVYVRGHGVFTVNDMAADWLDKEHGVCTLDLASPNVEAAMAIGNEIKTVVRVR